MINWLKEIFCNEKTITKNKNPLDFTLTRESGEWTTERYCPKCLATIGHNEFMTDICNSCGGFSNYMENRSKRQLKYNEKWQWQYRYKNDEPNAINISLKEL